MKTIKNLTADELRKSILQLAIQGKLVKQNPDDEPASELVKKIYEEKKKLVAEGKIKKDKNESYIFKGDDNCYYEKVGKEIKNINDEIPFEIPENWTFFKLESLTAPVGNKKNQILAKEILQEGKYPVITQGQNLIEGYTNYENKLIAVNSDEPVLMFGDHTRNIKIIDFPFVIGADGTKFFKPILINAKYLFFVLSFISSNLKNRGYERHYSLLKNELIPLPPLSEQCRIVNKIENFNNLLKQYAILEQKLSLLESSFEEKLKASILQYAIEGKLVKQNPEDEPASVLLERIKSEKEKLIKEGKIKRDKNESFIYQSDDKNYYDNQDNLIDVPLEIPDNWLWCYLPTIASFSLGKTPERNNDKYWNNGAIPWVSISDLYDKKTINSSKEKVSVSAIIDVFKNIIVSKGTLLMSFKLTIGKTSILGMDAVHNEAIISIVPYYDKNYFIRDYLLNFLSILCQFIEQTSAIKGNTLNKEKLKRMLIPLPPECQIYKINDTLKRLFSFIES